MQRTDAIKECMREAEELGGEWHVVKIGGEYYSVN